MSPTDIERESCADCPNPNDGNDDWCTGGNSCQLKPFFTGFNLAGLQSKKICVNSKCYSLPNKQTDCSLKIEK